MILYFKYKLIIIYLLISYFKCFRLLTKNKVLKYRYITGIYQLKVLTFEILYSSTNTKETIKDK